ncbi:MAG: ribosomal RNA small subunit methyltransferase A [Nitrospirales bacterium]|nr:ribosomal RNA small subunit methyltransferase A [Nitrospirales bacterium]
MPLTSPRPRRKKSLGQHFLTDPNTIRKIIASADLDPEATVCEIGPGRGALTVGLCQSVSSVVAVEMDAELVHYLHPLTESCLNLDVQHGDALAFAYDRLPEGTVVVANLPYNISTPLLFRLLEHRDRFSRLILMLQWEVARRLAARPNTREYGALSVITQYLTQETTLLFKVSPTCFSPRPEVESAVIRLVPRQDTNQEETAGFLRTVRTAFRHRRKTMANSFREAGWALPGVHAALDQAKIARTRRAETLTVQEFSVLATILQHTVPNHDALPKNG